MAEPFTYDRASHRYRASNGRYLSAAKVQSARDTFLERRQATMRAITAPVTTGATSVQEWSRQMREAIKRSHVAAYMLGKGGRKNMTQADWGRVGRALRTEYTYLGRFASEVAAGRLTPAQAEARAALYGSSATPYEMGRASDWGITLPVMPGQGCACRSSCRCSWDLSEDEQGIVATYICAEDDRSCEDCSQRSESYGPGSPYTGGRARSVAA